MVLIEEYQLIPFYSKYNKIESFDKSYNQKIQ